jgi:hypothetical protein
VLTVCDIKVYCESSGSGKVVSIRSGIEDQRDALLTGRDSNVKDHRCHVHQHRLEDAVDGRTPVG